MKSNLSKLLGSPYSLWALVDGNLVPALANFAPLILAQVARLWKLRPALAVQERA